MFFPAALLISSLSLLITSGFPKFGFDRVCWIEIFYQAIMLLKFNNGIKDEKLVRYRLTITENVITCCGCFDPLVKTAGGGVNT